MLRTLIIIINVNGHGTYDRKLQSDTGAVIQGLPANHIRIR